jgi:hypothetical protein
MDGTYLEMNGSGNIVFDDDSILDNVSISNTRGYESANSENIIPLIKWGGQLRNVKTSNNRVNNAPVHDLTNIKNGGVQSDNDVSAINSHQNQGQTRSNFVIVSSYPTIITNGEKITQEQGFVKRLNSAKEQLVLAGNSARVDLAFNEEIFRDDLVSIQIYSRAGADIRLIRQVRDPTDNKILTVWIQNVSDSDSTPQIYGTVLKVNSFPSVYG